MITSKDVLLNDCQVEDSPLLVVLLPLRIGLLRAVRLDDRKILLEGRLNHPAEVVAGILHLFATELLVIVLLVEVLVNLIDLQSLVIYEAAETPTHSVVLAFDLKQPYLLYLQRRLHALPVLLAVAHVGDLLRNDDAVDYAFFLRLL